ncbi:MAG: protein phosphatase 2C domain-containing protein [Gemmataceae bacterium]
MAPPLKIPFHKLTDVGVKRSHNQDNCAAHPATDDAHLKGPGHIFIVADGMGGHAVGEKASELAVRNIPLIYQKHVNSEGAVSAIRRSFEETNASIFGIGKNNPEFKGLGTTGTALFLRPEGAWLGHVGDSRAYRIRKGLIEQLTFDHSWVWEIARRQGIDPEELGDFKKNVIIRSLGPDENVEVDVEGPHPIEPGDTFVICSDGLSNQVTPDEIGATAGTLPPEEACQVLVDLANVRGGPDNITCIIVQIPGASKPGVAGKLAGPSLYQRANAIIPLPFMLLGLGSITTLVSVLLRYFDIPGSTPLFLVAAVLMAIGMISLIAFLVKSAAAAERASDKPQELRVYKSYTYELTKALHDRFAAAESTLKDDLKERGVKVDWVAHQRLSDDATNKANKLEMVAAFRIRCQSFRMLTTAFNKERNKGEAFQPNYTQQSKALS